MGILNPETVNYTEDPTSWHYIFTLPFFTSFLITILIRCVISPALGNHYIPQTYSNLGQKKAHFNTWLSSTVHGVVVSLLTSYLLVTGGMGTNPVLSKSPTGFAVMQISLGYHVSDFIVWLMDKDVRNHKANLVHHIASIIGIVIGLYHQGKLMYFIVVRFISLLTQPFINLVLVLTMLNRRNSLLFAFASICLPVTFFFSRLAPLYWIWKSFLVTLFDPASAIVPGSLRLIVFFGSVVLDILNIYWFWKIVKGTVEVISNKRRKPS